VSTGRLVNLEMCISSASHAGPVEMGLRYDISSSGKLRKNALQRIVDIIVLPTFVFAPYIFHVLRDLRRVT
jgi:hypothetical protein